MNSQTTGQGSDEPNYFTAAFLDGGFAESSSRSLRTDHNPQLFALIVEHLSGYDIVPLSKELDSLVEKLETVLQRAAPDEALECIFGGAEMIQFSHLLPNIVARFREIAPNGGRGSEAQLPSVVLAEAVAISPVADTIHLIVPSFARFASSISKALSHIPGNTIETSLIASADANLPILVDSNEVILRNYCASVSRQATFSAEQRRRSGYVAPYERSAARPSSIPTVEDTAYPSRPLLADKLYLVPSIQEAQHYRSGLGSRLALRTFILSFTYLYASCRSPAHLLESDVLSKKAFKR
ncbi:hypothetical protein JCM11641_005858 [Rhodosporidiobolus odoratus]